MVTNHVQIPVPHDIIQRARDEYLDPNHRVTQLVPATFEAVAQAIYVGMGSPLVDGESIWDVYLDMLEQVEVSVEMGAVPMNVVREWSEEIVGASVEDDEAAVEGEEQAFPGLFDVPGQMPQGIGEFNDGERPFHVDFSDDEEEDANEAWMAEELA